MNHEFWEKIFEEDSKLKNKGVEEELNRLRAMIEIQEIVKNKISMEGDTSLQRLLLV